MTIKPFVYLRDKISGKVEEVTAEAADRRLRHPVLGKRVEVVENKRDKVKLPSVAKPEPKPSPKTSKKEGE